jgi:hypothetical protein
MNLLAIVKVTQIAAAVSSIALARRRAEHVPAAVALVALTGVALARGPLNAVLPAPSVEPWQGAARVLVYLDGAAEMASYATIAGLAVAVAVGAAHRRRALALAVAAWALASVVLGALYPSPLVRGAGLQRVYFAADLIGLFVSAVALVGWAQRNIAAKRSPDSASMVALSLVALDGAILLAPFSPWRGVLFGSDFSGIQVIITMFFATFAVVQVIAWRFSSNG